MVRKFKEPAAHFLCPLSKSKGVITFNHFVVRDVDEGTILFDFVIEDEEISVVDKMIIIDRMTSQSMTE